MWSAKSVVKDIVTLHEQNYFYCDNAFQQIYRNWKIITETLDVEMKIAKLNSTQRNRPNSEKVW